MSKLKIVILSIMFMGIIYALYYQTKAALDSTKLELNRSLQEAETLKNELSAKDDHKGDLVHYVFLDVKDDISEKQYDYLLNLLRSLSQIPSVADFELGRFESMDDDRSISDRDINFEMRFENKLDYYAYQKSDEHMRIRESLSPYLAKAPLTYDYILQ